MASGKFSNPRPYREEDRQIEKAYRQVTGQEPLPEPKWQEPLDSAEDTLLFTETLEDLSQLPTEDLPEEQEPVPTSSEEPVPSGHSRHWKLFPDQEPEEENFPEEASLPQEEESADGDGSFLDTLMAYGAKVMDFLSENKKIALAGICACALILIVTVISVFFASTADPYGGVILDNVYVAGVNLGGLTKKEAVTVLKEAADAQYAREPMVIDLAGTKITLSPADVAPQLNAKAAVNAAYDYGRKGTNAEKDQAYLNSLTGRYEVPLLPYLKLNEHRVRDLLEAYATQAGNTLTQTQYGLEGVQPELSEDKYDPNAPCQTLVITIGTPGVALDVDQVYDLVMDAYNRHQFLVTITDVDPTAEPDPLDLEAVYEEFYIAPVDAHLSGEDRKPVPGVYGYDFDMEFAKAQLADAPYGQEIRISMRYIEPAVLMDAIALGDVLGAYQTSYSSDANRTTNLRLACQAINGFTIEPGKTFSFNDLVGQRSAAKGYKYAKADTMDEGEILGGGTNQVASTLYYCVLLSDLDILARTSHTYPVSYIDYGFDASTTWGSQDLKFRNNTDFPIQIEAKAEGGYVSIRILGTDHRTHYVRLENRIHNTYVPNREYKDFAFDNAEGYKDGDVIQEGRSGFHIKTFKLYYSRESNELLSRTAVTDSYYDSLNEIVAQVEPEPTTAPTTEPTTVPTESSSETTTTPESSSTAPPESSTSESTSAPSESSSAPSESFSTPSSESSSPSESSAAPESSEAPPESSSESSVAA